MPPFAPQYLKTQSSTTKLLNKKPKPKIPKPNSQKKNALPSPPTSDDDEDDGVEPTEAFLIPTSIPQDSSPSHHNQDLTQASYQLQSISSSFYSLPVRHQSQETVTFIYFSTKATFPKENQSNTIINSSSLTTTDDDRRTLFMTNIGRETTVEELKRFFSDSLSLDPNQIEALIHHPSQHHRPSRPTLFERECLSKTPSSSTISKPNSKKSKKLSPTDSSSTMPPLMILTNEATRSTLSPPLLPSAYIRFKTPGAIDQILSLQSSQLPLQWPESKTESNWLSQHRALRQMIRPSHEAVKAHTDAWMAAFEKGVITPISTPEKRAEKSKEEKEEEEEVEEVSKNADDEDGWTKVTRGGQHGRSSTIPTQQPENQNRGADPYAQSSMAGRDEGAGAKVMKRGFAEAFSNQNLDSSSSSNAKRKGGNLNTSFYRTNVTDSKKAKMNELRRKFDEDKARVERMRHSRKFKPY